MPFANYMRNQEVSYMKQEQFFTAVKLKEGLFTDSGYRFRYNIFNKTSSKNILFGSTEKIEFYDLQVYNHDEFEMGQYDDPEFYYFAELWFRLQVQ